MVEGAIKKTQNRTSISLAINASVNRKGALLKKLTKIDAIHFW